MVFADLDWKKGDIVVTGSFEHQAVAGWEYRLSKKFGVEFKKISPTESDIFDLDEFENFIRENHQHIRLVAFTQASNATGDLVPAREILGLCRKYSVTSMLDGAQTAGIVKIDIEELKPDIFLFAGHKGTMGPHGIGGLYLSENAGIQIPDVNFEKCGCNNMANHCDAGSINLEGMIALAASMNYINNLGFQKVDEIRNSMNTRVYEGLQGLKNVEILSKSKLNRTYAIAFRVKGMSVSRVLKELSSRDCVIGGGFFCCARAHEELGTQDEGVLRISAGLLTTDDELDRFFEILTEVAR